MLTVDNFEHFILIYIQPMKDYWFIFEKAIFDQQYFTLLLQLIISFFVVVVFWSPGILSNCQFLSAAGQIR